MQVPDLPIPRQNRPHPSPTPRLARLPTPPRKGGRRAAREQLLHLCESSERENVEVRILTVEARAFPGAGHAVLYADGAVPQLDTVQLDSAHGGEFTHAESQLARYRTHMEWWRTHTLRPQESRDLIHAIAHEL